jgi:hypothetical protein
MSGVDRVIRWSTAFAVVGVAAVAAVASYEHAYRSGAAHGKAGWMARLVPLKTPVPALALWLLGLAIPATLAANVAHGLTGGNLAAWRAVALVGSYELLSMVIQSFPASGDGTSETLHAADPPRERAAESFAGQPATDAILTDVVFGDFVLREADFAAAKLTRVRFPGRALTRDLIPVSVTFRAATCSKVDLRGASLDITDGFDSARGARRSTPQPMPLAPLAHHLGINVKGGRFGVSWSHAMRRLGGAELGHGRARTAETLGEIHALRCEVEKWRIQWDVFDAMGAHLTHLDLLNNVLSGLLDEISTRAHAISASPSTGLIYEACRREDRNLLHARRLWRWYADKLDQRSGPAASSQVRTLRAADELTWSCWKTALTSLGVAKSDLPAAPIPYLAPQFSASATPRTDPPPDLRPGKKDDLLIKHVEKLPIPVIALPPACERRPWWLILAAHEAGHHVQFELPGMEERSQDALTDALGDDAEDWLHWCRELFADACAVLLTGPAALWAIAELEMRDASGLLIAPSDSYPPPLVRLHVARAVASQVGLPVQAQVFDPGQQGVPMDERIRQLLISAPRVADALLGVTAQSGRSLRSLADMTVRGYDDRIVASWRKELLGQGDPVAEQGLDAARFCAAGSVAAWESVSEASSTDLVEDAAHRLAARVLGVLPDCREPGVRAAARVPDATTITREILEDLDSDTDGDGDPAGKANCP